MVAASGYTLLKHGSQLQTHDLLVLGTGFVVLASLVFRHRQKQLLAADEK